MSESVDAATMSDSSSLRTNRRDAFIFDILRNAQSVVSRRPSAPLQSPSPASTPLELKPPLRRDPLPGLLASPSLASDESKQTLASWSERWFEDGKLQEASLLEVVDVFTQVVSIVDALLAHYLALVICRPDYFAVKVSEDTDARPIVQLCSFAGAVEMPGWESGQAAGAREASAYIEQRMLDPSNLPFMARELFANARDWQAESAAIWSCGQLFKACLTQEKHAAGGETPKDDFDIVARIYEHLRRGSEHAPEDPPPARSSPLDLLHQVITICTHSDPSARYTVNALKVDLQQVRGVAKGKRSVQAVEIGAILQMSRYRDEQDVLIDRSKELAALDAALEEVTRTREMKVVHVFGPSGSGKSRLLSSWLSQLQRINPFICVASVKLDSNVNTPLPSYAGIIDSLLANVRKMSGDDWSWKADAQSLLRGNPQVASLLSANSRKLLFDTDETFDANDKNDKDWTAFSGGMLVVCKRLLQLFTSHSGGSTILVIDDLQWISQSELELWRNILHQGTRFDDLLVISIHRSTLSPPPAALLAADSLAIVAPPLSPAAIGEYLRKTFKWDAEPTTLTAFIVSETGGNAFYVRRLIRVLVERIFTFHYETDRLGWEVDLGALPSMASDGLDRFVGRAVAKLSKDALEVLQTLTCLPTRDIEISLLADFHPSLPVKSLLTDAAQRGIVHLHELSVRWAHDKYTEAVQATIPRPQRRQLAERFAWFLSDRPTYLFDAADNLLDSRESSSSTERDPELAIFLCKAATASLRASIQSADRYLSAAQHHLDFNAASSWSEHPDACLSFVLAKAETVTKLSRVTQEAASEVSAALEHCSDPPKRILIWTALVRMCTKTLPDIAVQAAQDAISAAGYSFEDEHSVPSSPEDFAHLQEMLSPEDDEEPAGKDPQTTTTVAIVTLLAHFVYTTFMTMPVEKQFQVACLGVSLASSTKAALRTPAAAYLFSWRGHQLSMILQLDYAKRYNSIASALLEQFPGSPFEADTTLTLDLQRHLTTPMRDISYSKAYESALSTGNWRMLAFALTLGTTSAVIAGKLYSQPDGLFADFPPNWDQWAPFLGPQCLAFMGCLREVTDKLVSPAAASYPFSDELKKPGSELVDEANPVFTLAVATVLLQVAIVFDAPQTAYPSILTLGEATYGGGNGMPLHYEFAFLRSFWRLEVGSDEDQPLVERDIAELGHITATKDWSSKIALLRSMQRLRAASKAKDPLPQLLDCVSSVEDSSRALVEAGYDIWSNALFSRFARMILKASSGDSTRLAFGFAADAYASASRSGAFGLAQLYARGFESHLSSLSVSLQSDAVPTSPTRRPSLLAPALSARMSVATVKPDRTPSEEQLDSRLKLSTVLRSLVLVAGEDNAEVLIRRLLVLLMQFSRADYCALALCINGSDELILSGAGEFETVRAHNIKVSAAEAASLAPTSVLSHVHRTRQCVSSQKSASELRDVFFDGKPAPKNYAAIPLRNASVLFLSSQADFLLDLHAEGSQSREVVEALANIASISLDSVNSRRMLEATVTDRTAALSQALAAERSFQIVISHEIKTPLFAILGLATVLESGEHDALAREQLAQIKSSGEDLSRLIDQVLDYSRLQSGIELESIPFVLRDIVEQSLDSVAARAQRKGLEVVCDTPVSDNFSCTDSLVGDPFRVKQIIVNFLSNAVKFTEEGYIQVTWEQQRGADGNSQIVVAVRDTGSGLSPEQHQRLFKSFSQADASIKRQHGGTGLGLVISRELAQALGGNAWVESEGLGKGSTFFFSFKPTFRESSHPYPFPKLKDGNKPRRVLLFAPPPSLTNSISKNLRSFGLTVDTSISEQGTEPLNVLDVIKKEDPDNTALITKYELLLLSPDSIEAEDVQRIKEIQPRAKILFVPKMIEAASEASRLKVPLSAILSRPVKAHALYRACFNEQEAEDARGEAEGTDSSDGPRKRKNKKTGGSNSKAFAKNNPIEPILFVDDNPVNVSVGVKLLKMLGYSDIDTASDGKQAVDAAAAKPYELILMDLQMPVLDGFSAARGILSDGGSKDHPLVVALTANNDEHHRSLSMETGFFAFCSKPLQMDRFKEVLRNVSKQKRTQINDPNDSDEGADAYVQHHMKNGEEKYDKKKTASSSAEGRSEHERASEDEAAEGGAAETEAGGNAGDKEDQAAGHQAQSRRDEEPDQTQNESSDQKEDEKKGATD